MGNTEKMEESWYAKECVPHHLAYLLYFSPLLQVVFVRRLELEKAELRVLWIELYIRNVVLEARIVVGPPLDVLGYFEKYQILSRKTEIFLVKTLKLTLRRR